MLSYRMLPPFRTPLWEFRHSTLLVCAFAYLLLILSHFAAVCQHLIYAGMRHLQKKFVADTVIVKNIYFSKRIAFFQRCFQSRYVLTPVHNKVNIACRQYSPRTGFAGKYL